MVLMWNSMNPPRLQDAGGCSHPMDVLAQLWTKARLHLDLEINGEALALLGRPMVIVST